jgi:tRNA C32,U32 (ribose-2'-O)-methylase TrmJ
MTAREVLEKEGVAIDDALRDVALLTGLSKISRYEAECHLFESRYGMQLHELQAKSAAMTGREDFKLDDDLMEWEFASAALDWLRRELDGLEYGGRFS